MKLFNFRKEIVEIDEVVLTAADVVRVGIEQLNLTTWSSQSIIILANVKSLFPTSTLNSSSFASIKSRLKANELTSKQVQVIDEMLEQLK